MTKICQCSKAIENSVSCVIMKMSKKKKRRNRKGHFYHVYWNMGGNSEEFRLEEKMITDNLEHSTEIHVGVLSFNKPQSVLAATALLLFSQSLVFVPQFFASSVLLSFSHFHRILNLP